MMDLNLLIFLVVTIVSLSTATSEDLAPIENLQDTEKVNRFRQHASRDHVLEELEHQINTKDKNEMTDQELQFHYFKLHDFDNNNLLDGLEIIKALTHAHDEATQQAHNTEATPHIPPKQTEEELVKIIDDVLKDDDLNGDGYVSFYEFMADRGNSAPASTEAPAPET